MQKTELKYLTPWPRYGLVTFRTNRHLRHQKGLSKSPVFMCTTKHMHEGVANALSQHICDTRWETEPATFGLPVQRANHGATWGTEVCEVRTSWDSRLASGHMLSIPTRLAVCCASLVSQLVVFWTWSWVCGTFSTIRRSVNVQKNYH